LQNAHLLDHEKQICAHGRNAGKIAVLFGRFATGLPGIFLDRFDVDADGVLVFYEANATMNLFSTARMKFPTRNRRMIL